MSFPPQISLIKERITVQGLTEELWKEVHDEAINQFINDPGTKLMVAYVDPLKGFLIEHAIPAYLVDQLTYFIKANSIKELNADTFLQKVQYGTIKGNHIESLLRMMMGIYAPIFFENTTWPDSILYSNSLF